MAKGREGNNRAPAPAPSRSAPVAVVNQRGNSNTGVTTRTVTSVNGARQAQGNSAGSKRGEPQALRNPNQDKNHWSNANYGARFGRGDLSSLKSQGYNSNQIMKIAQMAYAGGANNINKINKTNQALYNMSADALRVGKNTSMRQGQAMTNYFLPGRAMAMNEAGSRKVLGWNGFGDSMSINRYGGGDSYKQTGVWSLPSAYRSGGGAPIASGGSTVTGGQSDGVNVDDFMMPDELPPEKPEEKTTEMPGSMSGGGAGINSAMGIRRKKSSWKSAGISTKGTSNMNRGLTINSFNV